MLLGLAAAAGADVLSKEYEEHLAQGRQLLRQERYEEAEPLYQRALAIREANLPSPPTGLSTGRP